MSTHTPRLTPADDAWWLASLLAAEFLALLAYFGLTSATMTEPRYMLYPLLWIAVGVWAVLRVDPPAASERARWAAGGLAAVYTLALAGLTGLVAVYLTIGEGAPHAHAHVHGLSITMAPPGWGPRVAFATDLFHVYVVPFRVVGYLALGYLLYVNALDAVTATVPGVLGVATCLSCALPLASSVAGAVGGAALAGAVATYSLDISTAAFLLAAGLLAWRPGRRADGA